MPAFESIQFSQVVFLHLIFILGQGSVHLRLWVQVAGRPEGGLSDQRAVVWGSAQVQQVVRLDISIYYDTFYEPLRVS